ncbi:MAG: hypothetical protein V7K14_23175 [Nostoc sp.]|uniref:hypothetical protein n=1 Tax=Nostoc sp. TaxID=1180 RepID=UPI002FF9ECE6
MYRFWRLDIKANSVHSSKFSNYGTSYFNKSLTAWVEMAIAKKRGRMEFAATQTKSASAD